MGGTIHTLSLSFWFATEKQLDTLRFDADDFIATAAYGDDGPGCIYMKIAYRQGGYETGRVSRVAPEVEDVLMPAIRELLGRKDP